jgi:hypothetical protein
MITDNLQTHELSDFDIDTGPRSAMKALGQNNPSTMSAVWSVDVVSDSKGGTLYTCSYRTNIYYYLY